MVLALGIPLCENVYPNFTLPSIRLQFAFQCTLKIGSAGMETRLLSVQETNQNVDGVGDEHTVKYVQNELRLKFRVNRRGLLVSWGYMFRKYTYKFWVSLEFGCRTVGQTKTQGSARHVESLNVD